MSESSQVKVKGFGFEGIVAALRPAFEKQNELVPEPLRHWLREPIESEAWYPLDDYLVLMRALASTIDPAKAKGDVYRAFGSCERQRAMISANPGWMLGTTSVTSGASRC